MRNLLLITLLSIFWASGGAAEHRDGELAALCTQENLSQNLAAPQAWAPVPKYKDPLWSELPQNLKKRIISHGESALRYHWQPIDLALFAEFQKDGNRTHYESKYFAKRYALEEAAMAELMEGEGRFLPQIEAGLKSIVEEEYWGLPAHYSLDHPDYDLQTIDLFSAETGSLLAWTLYLFGDVLPDDLKQQTQYEIQRRIIDEALNKKEGWRTNTNNWNTWICSNWLPCILFIEPDREKQIASVQEVAKSLDIFMDKYPADGGCDEGPGYYDRAAGSLLDALVALDSATGGAVNISSDDKLRRMTDYVCDMNIDGKYCVNFADGSSTLHVVPGWHLGAVYAGNDQLMSLVGQTANDMIGTAKASRLVYNYNGFTLGRMALLLDEIRRSPGYMLSLGSTGKYVLPFDSWFPNLQVMTARSVPNSSDGLFFAAKGGHNGESHNHLDIGNFIVYASGKPILIDMGVATYTKDTFSSKRYEAMNTQSQYHNVPIINGIGQGVSAKYKARDVKSEITDDEARFSLDIAGAYPEEAGVESWVRTIDLKRNQQIDVTESYKLSKYTEPSQIVLITPIKPVITDGKVTLGDYSIEFNKKKVKANYEAISGLDSNVKSSWHNLYRIFLTPTSKSKSNTINYTIK